VAPFCGSVLAYAAFTFTHPDDKFSEKHLRTGDDVSFGSLRLASRQYVTEAIGALYLIMTIGLAADTDSGSGKSATTSLAIGAILMIMIYAGA
jgi:glycerol uptake facilitator-like aquaporin